jgi:hypothetical protein
MVATGPSIEILFLPARSMKKGIHGARGFPCPWLLASGSRFKRERTTLRFEDNDVSLELGFKVLLINL